MKLRGIYKKINKYIKINIVKNNIPKIKISCIMIQAYNTRKINLIIII